MEYQYPLDLTGIAITNLVKDEPQVITEINGRHSQIIIPDYAPFYLDNLKVVHLDTENNPSPLIKDVDYFVAYPYQDLARESGKLAFGAIVIINKNAVNRFKIDYQTIGDKWVADPNYVKTVLLEKAYNPRYAYWDQMTNVQDKFPPQSHEHDITESDKYPALLAAIDRVTEAILTRDYNESSIYPTVVAYLDRLLPEMTSLEALGLDLVENLPIATIQEIQERLRVRKYITLDQVLTILDEDVTVPNAEKFDLLDTAIADILRRLNQAIQDINTNTGNISINTQAIAQINQTMSMFSQAVNGRFDQLESNTNASIANLRAETQQALSDLTTSLGDLNADLVNTLRADIDALAQSTAANFTNVNNALTDLSSRVTVTENHLADIQSQIDSGTIARNRPLPTPFTYFLTH